MKIIGLVISVFLTVVATGQFYVPESQVLVDFLDTPYDEAQPGDTIYLLGSERQHVIFRNFQGTKNQKIIFTSQNDLTIKSEIGYGVSIQNSSNFIFEPATGRDLAIETPNGVGLGIGDGSTLYTIRGIEIGPTSGPGILAKSDPDCAQLYTRNNFLQDSSVIEFCNIHDTGTEGIYMGSTFYRGQNVNCNGVTLTLMPHLIKYVRISNNVLERNGWDGIQVSSTLQADIFDNEVIQDSRNQVDFQMSGILLGNGTSGNVYRNVIADGFGMGIMCLGNRNQRIFNNLILNPGLPGVVGGGYGLYYDDLHQDSTGGNFFAHNSILNPAIASFRYIQSNALNPGDSIFNNAFFVEGGVDPIQSPINTPFFDSNNQVFGDIGVLFQLPSDSIVFTGDTMVSGLGMSIDLFPQLSTDYFQTPRDTFSPDIGAISKVNTSGLNPDINNYFFGFHSGKLVYSLLSGTEGVIRFYSSNGQLITIIKVLGTGMKQKAPIPLDIFGKSEMVLVELEVENSSSKTIKIILEP